MTKPKQPNAERRSKLRLSVPRYLSVMVAAVISAVVLSPVSAAGGQIDNDGEVDVLTFFNCGVACGGYLPIRSGGSVATAGAGIIHAGLPVDAKDSRSVWICETGNFVPVQEAGELGLVVNLGKKNSNGDHVAGTETFTWVSKSGYDPSLRITHGAERLGGNGGFCWGGL